MVDVRSNQEEIYSNMEIESRVETEGYRTGYNVETKEMVRKNVSTAWRRRKKGKEMHKSYADIVRG